ncbi:FAFR582Wp [Eremothecium gossypii FDAG1]|nr:FAFR582Wp [Eremothecium gossypii FDAG1]
MDGWPAEIWMEICKLLGPADLFRLRLCSTKLNRIVCDCSEVWHGMCTERWLAEEAMEAIVQGSTRNTVGPGEDWFQYFRFRSNVDARLARAVAELGTLEHGEGFWQAFWGVFRFRRHMVPFLRRETAGGYSVGRSLRQQCLAQRLLTTLRHGAVFACIDGTQREGEGRAMVIAEEALFVPIAAMDPCFDRLLAHRAAFFAAVQEQVQRDYGAMEQFHKFPDTIRVDKLVTYIWRVFERVCVYPPNQQRCHLEDIMLLRVYCGEARGHPLLLMAIVQAVAARYGVQTLLCEQVLIIIDRKLRGGQSYLMIPLRGNAKPRIFTRRRLLDTMRHTIPNIADPRSLALARFLTPLTKRAGAEKIFKDWSIYCDKSIWRTIPDHSPNGILRYLPHSCTPMDESIFEYFIVYWKTATANHSTNNIFHTVLLKQFETILVKKYPGDAIHFVDCREQLMDSIIEMSFRESICEHVSMQHIHKVPEMGCIVRQKNSGSLSVVIGGKKTDMDTYLVIMDIIGNYNVVHGDDVEVTREYSWDLILKLMSMSDLGIYFERWDKESKRLVLNKQLQEMITPA